MEISKIKIKIVAAVGETFFKLEVKLIKKSILNFF